MPCNSDYLDPTNRERELQRTAQLLVYVQKALNEPIDKTLKNSANDVYCHVDYVPNLCAKLKGLSFEEREAIVYNAKDRTARDLADWWEDHQRADDLRIRILRGQIDALEEKIANDQNRLEVLKAELATELAE